ncbi:succinate dehydrogenase complex flavoprotein subunit A [Homo sapiens]|uniref:Succinate dehydrogenase complex flavoprotein subunit A n=1 Tax=Homo sapiens TaxID=9606 RepID=D6REB7_HUMAN|nr:succinate dehydrogenase complex flavoprotein subunit A [Homo sapiens]KAI4020668.1 succinate dehydrogenase complex flavoprotein subunit A [Homo sapiens]
MSGVRGLSRLLSARRLALAKACTDTACKLFESSLIRGKRKPRNFNSYWLTAYFSGQQCCKQEPEVFTSLLMGTRGHLLKFQIPFLLSIQ